MQLARIIGTATATVKHPSLTGATLFVVQPLMADRATPDGDPQLAIDTVAAGTGDLVMITSDGRLLRDVLKTGPSEHLRDKKAMRFLTSVDADLDYRNSLAERATAVGDRLLEGDTPVLYSGVPLQPIPLFPETLGATGDQTSLLLCNPKNIHVGIWRNIRIESARDISEGTLKIVATLRFDVKFAEEPGVAKAINVQL
jgi:microcompartment protein CcmK/EutM